MRLLVVRHAIAEDREEFAASGQDDRLRPLTPRGVRRMKRAARGLRRLIPSIDVLAASPLVRAAQTAEIVQGAYGIDEVITVAALAPEALVTDLAAWLSASTSSVVAIVGHEPQLGHVIGYLIGAGDRSAIELKKGAVSLLELDGREATAGSARLIWSLPPRVLRDLDG